MNLKLSVFGRALSAAAALATVAAGLAVGAPRASAITSYSYVDMGDSLSSGEGTYNYISGTNTSGNVCHRSVQSYAAQYVQMSVDTWDLTNIACSGAGTYEIYATANPNAGGNPDAGEPSQDSALSASTRLVTISIGINDLGLIGFAFNCYATSDLLGGEDSCFTAIPGSSTYKTNLANLPGELGTAYQDIRDFAPNATVAVLNYPQIYPSTYTGTCQTIVTPLGPVYLVTSQNMLNTAHALINQLNSAIATEVAKFPNFILVDESNALAGHDVCSSSPWVNQINNANVIAGTADDESLHPTARGYQAMATVLAARLDPGYFSNLSQDTAIHNAYNADGGLGGFGWPYDNGGGTYVHYWGAPRANVQDFSGGSFGPAILVDGPDGAFFVNYGFRTAYISGNYASTCLAPTDNAYSYNGGTRQDFVNCYMTWTSAGGVVVHGPNPATCTDYGGSTMTGPNACIGFKTAPPPGKPASGNVWYSGGGVGLYGQEIWTYANGTVATSTAIYSLTGLNTARASQLQAYIPNNYSDASHAHYHFCTPSGGCADGYVNQNNYTNQWATFGTVCTADGTATITLADDGGDVYPAIVGADAIRAVPTGISCSG
jgi:lysophospholipase L1-like esterase